MAIMQLGVAFQNFFAGRAKYPKFRKKGVHDRFTLTNDQLTVDGSRIRIPNLGWVRMRESLRFAGRIMSATRESVADMILPAKRNDSRMRTHPRLGMRMREPSTAN